MQQLCQDRGIVVFPDGGEPALNKMTFAHIQIPTADPKQHGTGQSGERRRVRYKKCKRD
jgi:hypothetical protein